MKNIKRKKENGKGEKLKNEEIKAKRDKLKKVGKRNTWEK